jgi:arylformamidase
VIDRAGEWIDVTRRLDDRVVCWPGRAPPQITWERTTASGHHCNVSTWQINAHSGTHLDAPLHFVDGGRAIDEIPLDVLVGECSVITDESIPRGGIRRLIVKTGFAPDGSGFEHHGALLSHEHVKAAVASGLVLIGTDRLSVDDTRGTDFALHRLLLSAGCVIIEGLDLSRVLPGEYELCALPLRVAGAEASPARVLLRASGV